MTPSEIVYKMLKDTNTTQTELARRLGVRSQGSISNRLTRSKSMTVENFIAMVDALGYEMVIRPKVMGDVRVEIVVNDA